MKNSRTVALFSAAAFVLAAASLRAQAPPVQQDPTPPQPTVLVPPAVNINKPPDSIVKQPRTKLVKYRGRVLAFNMASLIIQNLENPRMVWTFQYSLEMHQKVADMLSANPYQPGDKVTVYCKPGTTVAIKIKGKPSKSS